MSDSKIILDVYGIKNIRGVYKTRKLNSNIENGSMEIKLAYPESHITEHLKNDKINTIFKADKFGLEIVNYDKIIVGRTQFKDLTKEELIIFILDNMDVVMDGRVSYGDFGTLRVVEMVIKKISYENVF